MNKLSLRIEFMSMTHEKFEELMTLKRCFKTAKIFVCCELESRHMQVIEKYGERLTNLELKYCQRTDVAKILEKMPKLETLVIKIGKHEEFVAKPSKAPVLLAKLQKLTVVNDLDEFLPIKAPMLLNFRHEAFYDFFHGSTPGIFENFLKSTPKLESLHLKQIDALGKIGSSVPYQLKKLVIESFIYLTDDIEQFLLSQAATVETLEAYCEDFKFFEIVFTKFKRLKSLKTDLFIFDASEEFLEQFQPMPLLKELSHSIGDGLKNTCCLSEPSICAILKNCPALEKLDIHEKLSPFFKRYFSPTGDKEIIADNLDFIADNNRKLRFLSIRSINSVKSSEARFECLQHLELDTVDDVAHLIAFLKENLTIETLVVRIRWHFLNHPENLDALIELTNIKHVELRAANRLSDKIFDVIKKRLGTCGKVNFDSDLLQIDITIETQQKGFKRRRSYSLKSNEDWPIAVTDL